MRNRVGKPATEYAYGWIKLKVGGIWMKRPLVLLTSVLLIVAAIAIPVFAAKVETVSLWAEGEEGRNIGAVIPLFEKEFPAIKVKLQVMPWSAANDRFVAAVAGGTVPDVAQMGSTWMAQFADAGALLDLTPYLKKSVTVKMTNFFPSTVDLCMYKGKPYGLPWYADTRFIFYRKDILESVGYKNFPDNWDEFLDCCRKLRARGPDMYSISLGTSNYQEFMCFVWANGGNFFDAKGNITVTDAAFVEALKWYITFFKEKLVLIDRGGVAIEQDLASGRNPMYIGGYWETAILRNQYPQISGKWSIGLMPKKKSRSSFMGGCELVMFNDTKHKTAAWKFMEFMSRPDIQIKWQQAAGALPACKAAWETEAVKNDPMMQTVFKQLQEGTAPPQIPQWSQIEGRVQTHWQEACYGAKTPDEAMKAFAEDLKKIMGK